MPRSFVRLFSPRLAWLLPTSFAPCRAQCPMSQRPMPASFCISAQRALHRRRKWRGKWQGYAPVNTQLKVRKYSTVYMVWMVRNTHGNSAW
ncbi:hypothetical protein B0T26DRAFT_727236 [Lasiosphaeria miniovina]|uniref:Secreted protein n=1 Tax=Lasiosphaeria miniovina TaxID=1954250 RepID=A0AA39ZZN8_9PEZI|nr:uncharacterized protein B0T26DRAFT_727236 [Lasiosphaeria miniovina]KAK0706600.1 hypothetical protein B0T26DRAFT_727236 [Lasiosphaeria miniovina]